jgi:hypothetical protein
MDGTLQAHLDTRAALGVEQMEGDSLGARGREELDRDHGQAERVFEVLDGARHGVLA